MPLSSAYFLSTRGTFSYFYCAAASVVHHECFTADISGWSASAFHSSCLVTAMEIGQQANCIDIMNSLFFSCYLGLFIPLASCRWGTVASYHSHGQDLLCYHLSICWIEKEQVLSHPHRGTGLTCYRPSRLVRVLHSTSNSQGEQMEEEREMKPWWNYNCYHSLRGSLTSDSWKEQTGRNNQQNILHKICACGLLCSQTSTFHESNKWPLYHRLVPVLLSATCFHCWQPRSTFLNSSVQRPVFPLFSHCMWGVLCSGSHWHPRFKGVNVVLSSETFVET